MSNLRSFLMLCTICAVSACSYTGGINDPITRKFSWFSYVNGDDIRKVCSTLGADRYRFVYNGIYERQTRSYDVFFHSKKIKMQVRGEANIRDMTLDDIVAPWRGVNEELLIGDKELKAIKQSLIASAALHPIATGLRLYSDKFYWTVAACVDGQFYFNGYKWDTPRWGQMQFDDLLFALDVTGVDVSEPGSIPPSDMWGKSNMSRPFLLEIGENGLVGHIGG